MAAAVLFLTIAATIHQPSFAQRQSAPRPPYTLDEAVMLVKEKTAGRVLRAETQQRGERTIHRIRVITDDGRVRTIDVDAQRGILE
jgi:uncharacterized membrane protein YkoI